MKKSTFAALALVIAGVGTGGTALAQQIGVTKDQITIATIQDLSGPLAGFSKPARNGMQMRVDEINELGGIHGRKIKFLVEDSGYNPQKGLLAAKKLVEQDKIFATVGSIGTPVVVPAFPTLFEKNVMNLFPLTAARQMYEDPVHRLKFAFAAPYYGQIRVGVKWMAKERGAKKFCAIYQDDEFGTEIFKGGEDGLKDINLKYAEVTTFKRGATDFSTQVAKMKAADCDTVVMGTLIRETIGTIGTARKLGWNPNFIGSVGAYTDLIHKLGGKAMDGFYALFQVGVPYPDDASKNVRDWVGAYKTKFSEDPGLFSAYGYTIMDMFVQAAKATGPNLTTDNFIKAVEKTTFPRDMFGSPEYTFSPTKRLGNDKSRIGQIQNGRWVALTDYLVTQ